MTANVGSNTVESSTTEMIRKPASKTSEHRRITKPIMEKKRRARINNSLNELKVLILDALNKDPARHSKLEKADILEMTVRHLQKLQRQQVAATIVNDTSALNKYRAGFSECASEVGRYMNNMEGFDQTIRQRILSHLNHCVNSLNQMAANAQFSNSKTAFPGMVPPPPTNNHHSLHVHIPLHSHSGSNVFTPNHNNAASFTMPDINNNRTNYSIHHCSSPNDYKANLSTPPPSSASSTNSHFAFNLNLHSPKNAISLTTSDIFFRKSHLQACSSYSPGASSFASEQMSPVSSDGLDMAVDCTVAKSCHTGQDDNVWRPW